MTPPSLYKLLKGEGTPTRTSPPPCAYGRARAHQKGSVDDRGVAPGVLSTTVLPFSAIPEIWDLSLFLQMSDEIVKFETFRVVAIINAFL